MGVEILNSVFNFVGIVAVVLTAVSFIGVVWTGKIIEQAKNGKIENLQKTVKKIQPAIYSQEAVSLNVPDGKLFKQEYKLSISSPDFFMAFYTAFRTTSVKRIGKVELGSYTDSAREENGEYMHFRDYPQVIFFTDKKIEKDNVFFSLQKTKN